MNNTATYPTRFKATFRGTIIGWYDTLVQAQDAIEDARAEELKADADFLDWRMR